MAITRNGQIACIMQAMMGGWVVGGKHLTLVIHYWVNKKLNMASLGMGRLQNPTAGLPSALSCSAQSSLFGTIVTAWEGQDGTADKQLMGFEFTPIQIFSKMKTSLFQLCLVNKKTKNTN